MEVAAYLCYAAVVSFLLFLIPFAFFFLYSSSSGSNNPAKKHRPPLPPSPPNRLPVLGHLQLLKPPLPRTLADLCRRHGTSVLFLRLGTRRALVVSSPSAVEECFTVNDVAFASRPRSLASEILSYGRTTITNSPYGRLWRDLRRIATVEVLSTHRLQVLSAVRAQEVRSLVRGLFWAHPGGSSPARTADLSQRLYGLTLNNMTRMTTGKRYYGEGAEETEEARRFREIEEESLRLRGLTNRWDYLPWLRWFDVKGVARRMRWLRDTRDVFLQRVVEERRSRRKRGKEAATAEGEEVVDEGGWRRTAVDVLLSLQEEDPAYYTDDIIKSFILQLERRRRLLHGGDPSCKILCLTSWKHPIVLAAELRSSMEEGLPSDRKSTSGELTEWICRGKKSRSNLRGLAMHKEGGRGIDAVAAQRGDLEGKKCHNHHFFKEGVVSPGSDTTASTIEWAMTLLLNHPPAMQALVAELDAEVCPPGRMLEEADLPRLPYLHAVVCETLRLHPAAPVIVPHESTADCTVHGFHVPRGTTLLVNAWAIHRDPDHWGQDADRFRPERFLQRQVQEVEGGVDRLSSTPHPYRFIPFGAGRRRCPGEGLAMRVAALVVGTLVRCFEWGRVGEGEEDMKEGTEGITSPKAKPLEAMYRPRDVMVAALSQL
ncbi:hypothetical protein Taro_030925 [Colocasia esculenta]|uniref:Cytochrome P450 n=1 Tax=Colocasia esculenta TaxID=4460 RepID=A0A843VVB4_COLES|nr:hypothetical protein [Colocasia esculenta]